MISTNGDGWTMVVVMIMTMVMIKIDENNPIWQENEPKMKIPKNSERFPLNPGIKNPGIEILDPARAWSLPITIILLLTIIILKVFIIIVIAHWRAAKAARHMTRYFTTSWKWWDVNLQLFHIMLYRLLFFPTGLFMIDMLPDHDIRNLLVSSEGLTQTQQRRQTLFKTQLAVILSLMYTISIENRTRQFFCMSYHIRKHKFLQGSSRFKFKVKLTKHTRVLWTFNHQDHGAI